MVIGLNPATAASHRGGGGGGGSGGGKGGGGGVHDCGGDPDCGGQKTIGIVQVQVTETIHVISIVTVTNPVVNIVPSGPGTPGTITVNMAPTAVPATMVDYGLLLALVGLISVGTVLMRGCATGQHFPHVTIASRPTKAVKTSTDIPTTKPVDKDSGTISK